MVNLQDEPQALTMLDLVKAAQAQPTIAERLEKRFGLGDIPARRRALYLRLQSLVMFHGEKVEVLIREAASMAAGKNNPGRYFAKAVVMKLRETEVYTWKI